MTTKLLHPITLEDMDDDVPLITLDQVQKLPKFTTWTFLARNKRIEDDISVLKKHKFCKEEDYLLRNTIQCHGLSNTTLDCISEALEATPSEIKERYDSLLMQDTKKHNNTLDLDYNIEGAMDSFDLLFCRQCLVFDCQLHFDSKGLVLPSEKQPPMMPSGEDCNIPCGIHCHKLQTTIDDGLNALNWGSGASESIDGNNMWVDSNSPSCYKPIAENEFETIKTENDNGKSRNSTIETEMKRKGMEPKNYSQVKFLRGIGDGGWSTLEKDLYVKGVQIFGHNSCLIAANLLSGLKACGEIGEYMHCNNEPTDPRNSMEIDVQTRKKPGRERKRATPRQSEAIARRSDENELMPQYTPCNCQSACGNECSCLQNETLCEKYCGCSNICKNRYKGCHCVKNQCLTRYCPCFAADRECDPDICQNCWICCGDGSLGYYPNESGAYKCGNMRILLINKHRVLLGRSDISGWGVFAKKNMEKDEYIGEYTGEMISHTEAEKRGKKYDKDNSSFLFDLNSENVLDAHRMGSKMKFLNHSSTPNCYAKVMMVCGDHRLGIYANKNIQASEELFIDYKYKSHTIPKWMEEEDQLHPKKHKKELFDMFKESTQKIQ